MLRPKCRSCAGAALVLLFEKTTNLRTSYYIIIPVAMIHLAIIKPVLFSMLLKFDLGNCLAFMARLVQLRKQKSGEREFSAVANNLHERSSVAKRVVQEQRKRR